MAANASIPVINALFRQVSSLQALADFFTLEEKFRRSARIQAHLRRRRQQRLPLAHYLAARLGVHLRVATPANLRHADVVADSKARSPRNQS